MDKAMFLDEVFQLTVNHLERVYNGRGLCVLPLAASEVSDRVFDDLFWELEEEFGRMPTKLEFAACFRDAFDYVNRLYRIGCQVAAESAAEDSYWFGVAEDICYG